MTGRAGRRPGAPAGRPRTGRSAGRRHGGGRLDGIIRAASVVVGICAAGALGVMGLAARPTPAAARPVEGWEAALDPARTMGPADAPVRIVEFSDFQCPFCEVAQDRLRALHARYPGKIAVVYRHFPLTDAHPFAMAGALASECARDQGRFEAFHDALFAGQERIGSAGWGEFAAQAGVPDRAAFDRCVRTRRHRARIDEDLRHVRRLGLQGTPSFIVEGRLISGPVDSPVVDSIIQARLAAVAAGP
ncbi:MAG TPA: DsbA family protein [Longimicrobium sp.]